MAEAAERRRNRFQSPDTTIAIAIAKSFWSPFPRGMQTLLHATPPTGLPKEGKTN